MTESMSFAVHAILIGVGATIVVDLWAIFLKRAFGIPSLDWGMAGRWFGHMPHGRFLHDGIGRAAPIPGERVIGWTAHYLIGLVFAAVLLAIWGPAWATAPTPLPALIVGICTIVAPFFIMQPGMGAGIAASKTPAPAKARLRSLMTHTVFGIGLYLSALLWSWLLPA